MTVIGNAEILKDPTPEEPKNIIPVVEAKIQERKKK